MATRRGQVLDGVLLLDKPEGLSSNHALQRAKRTIDARKAGHTGTLDPFATGLLICCLGQATKLAERLLGADKVYEATVRFGEETDSGDLTGVVVAQADAPVDVKPEALEAVLPSFRGEIQQVPPMYSALKRDGKPLYEYARAGIVLEREPRTVFIHALDMLACEDGSARLLVHCSKGTYIRTLAQDIGRALGCYAHLTALRRTRIGPFDVADAVTLDTLQAMEQPVQAMLPLQSLPDSLRHPPGEHP